MDETFNGKSILEVFNITKRRHVEEYLYVQKHGVLKPNSIFLECELPILWQVCIQSKLADGYIKYWWRLN